MLKATKLLRNLLLLLLVFSAISACKKDDNPANNGGGSGGEGTFTINGAGINNQTYTVPSAFPGLPFNTFAYGSFNTKGNVTALINSGVAQGDTAGAVVAIGFLGNQTGNFQNASVPRVIIVVVGGRSFVGGFESPEQGSPTLSGTTFNLNVTRYEAVGGKIQGSYTGTLREASGSTGNLGTATITITGNFNVQRLSDDFDDGGGDILKRRPFAREK